MPAAPLDHMARCKVTTKSTGERCKGPRMRGLEVCRMHGVNLETRAAGLARVETAEIVSQARKYGTPRNVTPYQALREELARAQGIIDHLDRRVALSDDGVLLNLYQAERAQLLKIADRMIALGVDELEARLTGDTATKLELAINGIVRDLGHNPATAEVRQIIAANLGAALNPESVPDIIDAEVVPSGDIQTEDW